MSFLSVAMGSMLHIFSDGRWCENMAALAEIYGGNVWANHCPYDGIQQYMVVESDMESPHNFLRLKH